MRKSRLYNVLSISYLTLAAAAVGNLFGTLFFSLPKLNLLALVGLIFGLVGGIDLAYRPTVLVIDETLGVPVAFSRQRSTVRVLLYFLFSHLTAVMFGYAGMILGGRIGLVLGGVLGLFAGAFIASQTRKINSISDLFVNR